MLRMFKMCHERVGSIVDSEPLVRGIIAAMMLLENLSGTEIDPDVAVRGMEGIVGEIAVIEGRDRTELLQIISAVRAAEIGTTVGDLAEKLPLMMGLDGNT